MRHFSIREKRPIGRFPFAKHGNLSFKAADGTIYIRLSKLGTNIADDVTCLEVVRTVNYDVVLREQLSGISLAEALVVSKDRNLAVERLQALLGTKDLGTAYLSLVIENLPLEVRKAHDIIVHQPYRANASTCKIDGYRRAKPAYAHYQDARRCKPFLSLLAYFRQDELALVTQISSRLLLKRAT